MGRLKKTGFILQKDCVTLAINLLRSVLHTHAHFEVNFILINFKSFFFEIGKIASFLLRIDRPIQTFTAFSTRSNYETTHHNYLAVPRQEHLLVEGGDCGA